MELHLRLKPALDDAASVFEQSKSNPQQIEFEKYGTSFDFKSISTTSKTEQFFEDVARPMVDDKLLKKQDCLLFTLGPSNSGKSFTVFGDKFDNEGLTANSLKHIFHSLEDKGISNHYEKLINFVSNLQNKLDLYPGQETVDGEYAITISMFEIYNDSIKDLLLNTDTTRPKSFLDIITDPHDQKLKPRNLSQFMVNSYQSSVSLINHGLRNRATSTTYINSESSRSHCFVFINVHRIFGNVVNTSRMTIADLAGLERSKLSQTSGINLKEGSFTNASLTQLGRCLELVATRQFNKSLLRTNKLTRLIFNDYVKSKSLISIIVTLDPHGDEGLILQTLRYVNPIQYQKISRRSASAGYSTSSSRGASASGYDSKAQSELLAEIDSLRAYQSKLEIKLSHLENEVVQTEVRARQELYEENEAKLNQISVEHKTEIFNLKENYSSQTDAKLEDLSASYRKRIQVIKEQLEEKQSELVSMKDSLESVKSQCYQLTKANEELESTVSYLKEEENSKVLELSNSLEQSKNEVISLNNSISALEAQLSSLKSLHEVELTQLRSEKDAELQNLQNELSLKHQAKLDQLQYSMDLNQESLSEKDSRISELLVSLNQIKQSTDLLLNEKEAKINDLEISETELSVQLMDIKEKHSLERVSLQNIINDLESKLSMSKNDTDSAESIYKDQISQLSTELANSKKSFVEAEVKYQAKITELESQILSLKKQVEDANKMLQDSQVIYDKQLDEMMNDRQSALKGLALEKEQEIQNLKSEGLKRINKLEAQLAESQTEIKSLTDKSIELSKERGNLKSDLTEEINELETKLSYKEKMIDQVNLSLRERDAAIQRLKQQKEDIESSLAKKEQVINSLKEGFDNQIKHAEDINAGLAKEASNLTAELARQVELQNASNEKAANIQTTLDIQIQLAQELQSTVTKLQSSLNKETIENKSLRDQLASKIIDLSKMESKNKSIRLDLESYKTKASLMNSFDHPTSSRSLSKSLSPEKSAFKVPGSSPYKSPAFHEDAFNAGGIPDGFEIFADTPEVEDLPYTQASVTTVMDSSASKSRRKSKSPKKSKSKKSSKKSKVEHQMDFHDNNPFNVNSDSGEGEDGDKENKRIKFKPLKSTLDTVLNSPVVCLSSPAGVGNKENSTPLNTMTKKHSLSPTKTNKKKLRRVHLEESYSD